MLSQIREAKKETVYLNVYHVSSINTALECFGVGLYHTSVGMYDFEFSYGGQDDDDPGTVVVYKGNSAGLALKESIPVGVTYFSLAQLTVIIEHFGKFWTGRQYDPFRNNCNHFTEKLISCVCPGKVYYPSYINRFTKVGTVFRIWFKPL